MLGDCLTILDKNLKLDIPLKKQSINMLEKLVHPIRKLRMLIGFNESNVSSQTLSVQCVKGAICMKKVEN